VPVISAAIPNYDGTPFQTVQTPTAAGLLDVGSPKAVVAFATLGPRVLGQVANGIRTDGKCCALVNSDAVGFAPTSTVGTTSATWTIATCNLAGPGNVPGNARAVWLRLYAEITLPDPAPGASGSATLDGFVSVTNDRGGNPASVLLEGSRKLITTAFTAPSAAHNAHSFVVRVPLTPSQTPFSFGSGVGLYGVTWTYNGAAAMGNQTATILGWELGG
jgi:hypothetical protein